MVALHAKQIAQSLTPTEYQTIQLKLPKKQIILKNFWGLCNQMKQYSLI